MWSSESQSTIPSLYQRRLESDQSGEYLHVWGTKLTAADVVLSGWRISTALDQLGLAPQDRVATILENSPAAVNAWAGVVLGGRIAVPVNTAYKGYYLRHQLDDCGARVVVVAKSLANRLADVAGTDLPGLGHVIVVDDGDDHRPSADEPELKWDTRLSLHRREEVLSAEAKEPGIEVRGWTWPPSSTRVAPGRPSRRPSGPWPTFSPTTSIGARGPVSLRRIAHCA